MACCSCAKTVDGMRTPSCTYCMTNYFPCLVWPPVFPKGRNLFHQPLQIRIEIDCILYLVILYSTPIYQDKAYCTSPALEVVGCDGNNRSQAGSQNFLFICRVSYPNLTSTLCMYVCMYIDCCDGENPHHVKLEIY